MTLPAFETYFEELRKKKNEDSSFYKDRYEHYEQILAVLTDKHDSSEQNLKKLSELSEKTWQRFGHYSATVGIYSWLGYNQKNSDVFDNFSTLVADVVEQYKKDPGFYPNLKKNTPEKEESFAFVDNPKPRSLPDENTFEDSFNLDGLFKSEPPTKNQPPALKPSSPYMAKRGPSFSKQQQVTDEAPKSRKEKRKEKKKMGF